MTTSTTSATFEINNAKHYVPVVTLSINDNIEFLENVKQGFSITIFGTNLDLKEHQNQKTAILYLIVSTFRHINRLFVLSFKNGNNGNF